MFFTRAKGFLGKIYSYRLNEDKRSLIEKWVMDLKPLAEALRVKGLRVDYPARIIGRSVVEHVFHAGSVPTMRIWMRLLILL